MLALLAVVAALVPLPGGPVDEGIVLRGVVVEVSGRPGAVAACAGSEREWDALVADSVPGSAFRVGGLAFVREGRAAFEPAVCRYLRSGSPFKVGVALNMLAHEATHLRGVYDEGVAACEGLRWASVLAREWFRFDRFEMLAVVAGARLVNRQAPADVYGKGCR